jgi:hypothetical protein
MVGVCLLQIELLKVGYSILGTDKSGVDCHDVSFQRQVIES